MYIEIDHLCKRVVARDTDGVRREHVILDDITLSIDRGEFVCLLGFSGSINPRPDASQSTVSP